MLFCYGNYGPFHRRLAFLVTSADVVRAGRCRQSSFRRTHIALRWDSLPKFLKFRRNGTRVAVASSSFGLERFVSCWLLCLVMRAPSPPFSLCACVFCVSVSASVPCVGVSAMFFSWGMGWQVVKFRLRHPASILQRDKEFEEEVV